MSKIKTLVIANTPEKNGRAASEGRYSFALPPDCPDGVARGASILALVHRIQDATAKAGMLENLIPFLQNLGETV